MGSEYDPPALLVVEGVPLHPLVHVTVAPMIGPPPLLLVTVPVTVPVPAARYGPTNGPPCPTGSVPAGCTGSIDVSARARGMLIRPLPVCSAVPAGSAVRAMRPTITSFVSVESTAFMSAARPATCAAAAEVPLMTM